MFSQDYKEHSQNHEDKQRDEVKIEQETETDKNDEKEGKSESDIKSSENIATGAVQNEDDPKEDAKEEPVFPSSPAKSETLQDIRNNLTKFAEHLRKKSYEDKNTLNLLKCLGRYYWEYKKQRSEIALLLTELHFSELFKELLWYGNKEGIFSRDAIWFPVYFVLSVMWNFTDASKDFAKNVVEVGHINYLCKNLTHEPYMENINSKNVSYVIKASLSTLQNCVRHVLQHPSYEEEKLKDVLKPYLSSENEMFKTLAIMILSNILSEDENSKLEDAGSIPYMVSCLSKSVNSSKKRFAGFAILELLEAISRIAVNDDNKIKLVDASVLPVLVKIMRTGEEEEKQMAARVIWTLCFDENVKKKVVEEEGCLESLEKLSQDEDSIAKSAAKGALWKISGEKKHKEDNEISSEGKKHIFISYQHAHQKMVHHIKNRLKQDGYKIWIDTEQMGGSTLEAMALAVENAMVVIMCGSEKYKLSPNCRTEAEYTFQIKKPIIPLMMQRYYKPDGWLGMLFGAKMYVNFDGKFDFETAYQLLLKEMSNCIQVKPSDVTDGSGLISSSAAPDLTSTPAPLMQREPSAIHWDKTEVMNWATKHNLNDLFQISPKLHKLIETMNGRLLVRFCKMKKEAPEFFYNQLSNNYELDMLNTLLLTDAMDAVL